MNTAVRLGALILVVAALLAGQLAPGRVPTCSCGHGAALAQVPAGASDSASMVGGTPGVAAPASVATEATGAAPASANGEKGAAEPASPPATVRGPLPKLIDLGAGKCIACKKMVPILEEAKKLYENRAEVVFIDVWENPSMGPQYGIRMIPTQIFFDAAGKEVFRHEGFFPMEDIQKQFESMGVTLKKE